jgi:hypothetical protein
MDPTVIVLIVAIGTPVAVLWALAQASRLRGPLYRPESRRRVEALVTEAVPEEHPDPDGDVEDGPRSGLDSDPPREPGPEPGGRLDGA